MSNFLAVQDGGARIYLETDLVAIARRVQQRVDHAAEVAAVDARNAAAAAAAAGRGEPAPDPEQAPEFTGLRYYPITLDVNGVPSLGGEVELKAGPRTQRAVIEVQELEADGQVVGAVDVQV